MKLKERGFSNNNVSLCIKYFRIFDSDNLQVYENFGYTRT